MRVVDLGHDQDTTDLQKCLTVIQQQQAKTAQAAGTVLALGARPLRAAGAVYRALGAVWRALCCCRRVFANKRAPEEPLDVAPAPPPQVPMAVGWTTRWATSARCAHSVTPT